MVTVITDYFLLFSTVLVPTNEIHLFLGIFIMKGKLKEQVVSSKKLIYSVSNNAFIFRPARTVSVLEQNIKNSDVCTKSSKFLNNSGSIRKTNQQKIPLCCLCVDTTLELNIFGDMGNTYPRI